MIFNNLVCSQPRNTFPSSFPFHLFHPFCSLATIASLGGHAESYSSYRNEWPNGLKVESNYKWGTKLWMLRLSLSLSLCVCLARSLSLSFSRSRSRALARFLVRTHFCLLKSHRQIRFHSSKNDAFIGHDGNFRYNSGFAQSTAYSRKLCLDDTDSDGHSNGLELGGTDDLRVHSLFERYA